MAISCYHCGLPVKDPNEFNAEIGGEERVFCCHACQTVCETIYGAGLQSFYTKAAETDLLSPPPDMLGDLSAYDLDEVQSDFTDTSQNDRTIHLLVEGIHCAACVWLIENALSALPGVLNAEVNLTARRLKLHWDNSIIPLSTALNRLAEIGYAAVPFDPETAEGALAKRYWSRQRVK